MLGFLSRKKGIHLLLTSCTLILLIANHAEANGKKDCYTCNPDYVPGDPVDGNNTLGGIVLISYALLQGQDQQFMSDLSDYCRDFKAVHDKAHLSLKRKLIGEMEKTIGGNGDVSPYFIEAGCNPGAIAKTKSPMSHLASEVPEAYMKVMETVRKYFVDTKKPENYTKMLNAKNTQGHTTLDYVEWLLENKKYDKNDLAFLDQYKSYLCSHGAVYSVYNSSKSCSIQVAVVK